jgi:hypothetical protein
LPGAPTSRRRKKEPSRETSLFWGGEVTFRHNGEVNGDELRAKILEHMGRFYVPGK